MTMPVPRAQARLTKHKLLLNDPIPGLLLDDRRVVINLIGSSWKE